VSVILDGTLPGVVIPEQFAKNRQLMLNWGTRIGILELKYDGDGVGGVLSYNRVPTYTYVPWEAIFFMRDLHDHSKAQLWNHSTVDEAFERSTREMAAIKAEQEKGQEEAKKQEPDDFNVMLNVELGEEPRVSVTIISQSDLHDAYNAAKDKEGAQKAIELFDKYKAIVGGFKPGQLDKYNMLRRLAK